MFVFGPEECIELLNLSGPSQSLTPKITTWTDSLIIAS